jgi:hypothetical protein
MIRPAKDRKRRKKAEAKRKQANPQVEWAEAFMVLLLAKAGSKVSMSLETLEKYSEIKSGQPTELSYDQETGMVTLSLVDVKLPDKLIIVPKTKIITNINRG